MPKSKSNQPVSVTVNYDMVYPKANVPAYTVKQSYWEEIKKYAFQMVSFKKYIYECLKIIGGAFLGPSVITLLQWKNPSLSCLYILIGLLCIYIGYTGTNDIKSMLLTIKMCEQDLGIYKEIETGILNKIKQYFTKNKEENIQKTSAG